MSEDQDTSEAGASEHPAPAEGAARPDDGFQLSRVFALLSLVIGIFALGFLSMVYLAVDGRLETLEKSHPATVNALKERLDAMDGRIDEAVRPQDKGDEAKKLVIGSELSRTLYLMKYLAADESLSGEARQRAARVHAEADALLNELGAAR